jgi:hypothetical protein
MNPLTIVKPDIVELWSPLHNPLPFEITGKEDEIVTAGIDWLIDKKLPLTADHRPYSAPEPRSAPGARHPPGVQIWRMEPNQLRLSFWISCQLLVSSSQYSSSAVMDDIELFYVPGTIFIFDMKKERKAFHRLLRLRVRSRHSPDKKPARYRA